MSIEEKSQQAISAGVGVLAITSSVYQPGAGVVNFVLQRPHWVSPGFQFGAIVPFRGSIVGMGMKSSGNKTAGVATFTVGRNSVKTAAVLTWNNSTAKGIVSFPKGQYPFVAGDELDIRFDSDGSYSPTTNVIFVDLYLYVDQSTLL